MRMARTVEETRPIIQGLQFVADFLNAIGQDTTARQWKAFLKPKMVDCTGPFIGWTTNIKTGRTKAVPRMDLEEAKNLRRSINSDLGFVRSDKELKEPFSAIVCRLNALKLETRWQCFPLDTNAKWSHSQAIIKIRWNDGTTGRWTAQSWPMTNTPKDYFYTVLGKGLETGDLTRFKVCRQCGKYFVAVKDRKKAFCQGTKCREAFHARQRREDGYYTKRRQKRRKEAIRSASRLIDVLQLKHSDASINKLQKETGLPRGVIETLF
jgi:hypothetical protein